MFKNHLLIAWRNLLKNKIYSIINVLGLAAGMAVAMLIAFWIWDEVTYNQYHPKHKRLAQVMTTYTGTDGKMGKPVDAAFVGAVVNLPIDQAPIARQPNTA